MGASMIPFIVPEWLTRWASIRGIDWTRWSFDDALYWQGVAQFELGLLETGAA
jgi:hypothetical protein